ncbi:MAG: alpha/beta fold hydrolase [Steroidobacteraceae bacterium]
MVRLRTSAAALACLIAAACGRAPSHAPSHAPPLAPSHAQAAGGGAPLVADSADGVHIEYRVYGSGEPAIILIHGWACNSSYWREQLAPLEAKYTTVTLDLAGHGGSGRNRTDWSMARYGEDVAAVVRRLPIAHVILVGHSMGGPVALEAARLLGTRVIGIIGIDTFKRLGLPPPSPREVQRAVAPFRADFIGAMRRFVPTLFHPGANPAFEQKVASDMARAPAPIAIASLVSLNSMDYQKLLPAVHAPIAAIDSDLGHAASEARIRTLVPSFSEITLKGDGHFLMLQDPQRFNPLLLRQIEAMAREDQQVRAR